MIPSTDALAAHTFVYDETTLDKSLAQFIQKFYTLADERDHPSAWASCFTLDAVMRKGATVVTGRDGRIHSHYELSESS